MKGRLVKSGFAGVKKPRRIVNRPEQVLQISCVAYARAVLPNIVLFHPANEAKRSPVEWAFLYKMGFLKGLWDLGVLLRQGGIAWMEFKAKGCAVTPEQDDFGKTADEWGCPTYQIWSIEEFDRALRELFPREHFRAKLGPQGITIKDVSG
jgi:hypothetical protein